ncbi:uncharacterized protein LOC129773707 [Toxorhynchites rutilus septentrionalis]|uniref:uncharacterized protein LOC129773707 n=1 Tax=Toxorhynchites rutilus septentrionalis TaxID=329112 RepID=UPI002479ECA9|nr:uncharacterized protein LOC129773707 [Toxorhynchites rutilus septentrionalis]
MASKQHVLHERILEREYERCPEHDIKIIIGDFNTQIGKEQEFEPVIGMYSAHQLTNENALRLIDFATSKNMADKWNEDDGTSGDECQQVLQEKNAARELMLRQATRQNVERYRQKRRQQTQLFREKKRRQEEDECEELEQLYPEKASCREQKCDVMGAEDQNYDGSDYVGAVNNEDVPPPTIGEVRNAIKQLKNNKSTGKDGIGAELIKMGPEKLVSYLHRLIVRIWETEQLPQEWKDGVICPFFKKGDKLDCENFRAITVLNAAYKVLSQIIFRRSSPLTTDSWEVIRPASSKVGLNLHLAADSPEMP